jgi:hypothetical protein
VARRKIETYLETCDFCGVEKVTYDFKKPTLQPVYSYHFGGYGDMERIITTEDACPSCYDEAIRKGYGAVVKDAGYWSDISE